MTKGKEERRTNKDLQNTT